MRSLHDMAPDELLREYFAERRRREGVPSSAGIDPDRPRERRPKGDRYEELVMLTMGCSSLALKIMYEASWRARPATHHCGVDGCEQYRVAHEHREVMGNDGHPLLSGGVPMTEPVSIHVPPASISMRWGIEPKVMKRMVKDVLDQVAENMANRRGRERNTATSGPTLEDVKALAKAVLG